MLNPSQMEANKYLGTATTALVLGLAMNTACTDDGAKAEKRVERPATKASNKKPRQAAKQQKTADEPIRTNCEDDLPRELAANKGLHIVEEGEPITVASEDIHGMIGDLNMLSDDLKMRKPDRNGIGVCACAIRKRVGDIYTMSCDNGKTLFTLTFVEGQAEIETGADEERPHSTPSHQSLRIMNASEFREGGNTTKRQNLLKKYGDEQADTKEPADQPEGEWYLEGTVRVGDISAPTKTYRSDDGDLVNVAVDTINRLEDSAMACLRTHEDAAQRDLGFQNPKPGEKVDDVITSPSTDGKYTGGDGSSKGDDEARQTVELLLDLNEVIPEN